MMNSISTRLTTTFQIFFRSEKSSAILLIFCTLLSLVIANSAIGTSYVKFWHGELFGMSAEHWVNDGLMAIFFLFIGLELEREIYSGELSNVKQALLPTLAALGGLTLPALIHFSLNAGTTTQAGMGIPMATDIAFALGALALLGNRVPPALTIFLAALAVMDDLGAVIVIAIFYTATINFGYLLAALGVFLVMVLCNRVLRIMVLWPYLIGGAIMWVFMLKSGVHATISGILLAFAIPFSSQSEDQTSPSHRLENLLHLPVAFVILPVFALANTGVVLSEHWAQSLTNTNGLGILIGLLLGKPLGIGCATWLAVKLGICALPQGTQWRHLIGAGMLGGIGFTMSIFITNLAFEGSDQLIMSSKICVLIASLIAGVLGYIWLKFFSPPDSVNLQL